MTRKLYQEDVYKKECESTVVEILGSGTAKDPYVLVLDETVFFPEGGGQPSDLGTIDSIPVTGVFEKEGVVFHKLLSKESGELPAVPDWKVGTRVSCALDWNRRFEHMQRHCGEHILSGIFFRVCGGVNRGFHMGSGYMTIDIDVLGITWEEAQRIEMMTNEVIWANVPVTTRHYEHRSEAEKLPLRKALAIDEDITIVSVGDVNNPADCVACCGTHPRTSGQVGLLKILKLESYKGMTRVYFKAGKEALEDYQNKHRILTELNQKYSADDNDLLEKMKAQEEKNKEVRQELHLMKSTLIGKAVNEILSGYGNSAEQTDSASVTSPGLLIREYPYFRANELLSVTKLLTEKNAGINPLIVLVSTKENLLILASGGKHDCGKIVRDNAHVWRGKGGGNAAGARVMFPSRDDLDCFIIFIKQAYLNTR